MFFDLDWDEPNWKEKQMECATRIELVRSELRERNTRLVLILIQKHPNIPVDGDNVLARERYPALCNACSIKNNYLFLLHAEHLHGYINKYLKFEIINSNKISLIFLLKIRRRRFHRAH